MQVSSPAVVSPQTMQLFSDAPGRARGARGASPGGGFARARQRVDGGGGVLRTGSPTKMVGKRSRLPRPGGSGLPSPFMLAAARPRLPTKLQPLAGQVPWPAGAAGQLGWQVVGSAAPLDSRGSGKDVRGASPGMRWSAGGERSDSVSGRRPPQESGSSTRSGAVAPPPAVAEEPVPPPWPPGMAPAAAAPPAAPAAAAPAAAAAAAGAAADGAADDAAASGAAADVAAVVIDEEAQKAQKVADEERPPLATLLSDAMPTAPTGSLLEQSAATMLLRCDWKCEGAAASATARVGAALHLISMLARIASALGTLQGTLFQGLVAHHAKLDAQRREKEEEAQRKLAEQARVDSAGADGGAPPAGPPPMIGDQRMRLMNRSADGKRQTAGESGLLPRLGSDRSLMLAEAVTDLRKLLRVKVEDDQDLVTAQQALSEAGYFLLLVESEAATKGKTADALLAEEQLV